MARSISDEEGELERLDARADAVAMDLSDDEDDFTPDSSDASSSELSSGERRHDIAAAAAVVPRKRAKRNDDAALPPLPRQETDNRDLEEDDDVLRAASWRDLEDTRKFLENDHRERFNVLISRWEGVDDGDDVDLNTGRIVVSKGHLDALAPQKNLAFFEDSEEDDDDAKDQDQDASDEDDDMGDVKGDLDAGIDPLYIVCQKPSPLLDMVVASI